MCAPGGGRAMPSSTPGLEQLGDVVLQRLTQVARRRRVVHVAEQHVGAHVTSLEAAAEHRIVRMLRAAAPAATAAARADDHRRLVAA